MMNLLGQYLQQYDTCTPLLGQLSADTENVRGACATVREILQQPWTWRHTARLVCEHASTLKSLIDAAPKPRLILTGAGTSDYVGKSVQDFLHRALQRPVDARATTDIIVRPEELFLQNQPTLLVSFARSGNSPESVEAMRIGLECYPQVRHLVITCNADGALARLAHRHPDSAHLITLHEATHDAGLAMTSSYSSMVVAALGLGHLSGRSGGLEAYTRIVDQLAQSAEALFRKYSELLYQIGLKKYERVFFLGNGTLQGAAIEAALKLQELTVGRIVTQSETFLGFRHGPIAAVTDRSLIVYFLSSTPHRQSYEADLIRQLQGCCRSLLVCDISPDALSEAVDNVIELHTQSPDSHKAPVYAIVGQLLGMFSSLAFGLKPDNPPGDSGLYSRVVQGVTIYKYQAE